VSSLRAVFNATALTSRAHIADTMPCCPLHNHALPPQLRVLFERNKDVKDVRVIDMLVVKVCCCTCTCLCFFCGVSPLCESRQYQVAVPACVFVFLLL